MVAVADASRSSQEDQGATGIKFGAVVRVSEIFEQDRGCGSARGYELI
jgi:hypothetical protein